MSKSLFEIISITKKLTADTNVKTVMNIDLVSETNRKPYTIEFILPKAYGVDLPCMVCIEDDNGYKYSTHLEYDKYTIKNIIDHIASINNITKYNVITNINVDDAVIDNLLCSTIGNTDLDKIFQDEENKE